MRNEIDSCRYLYLRAVDEPEELRLRVVVDEARATGSPEDLGVAGNVVSGYGPIVSDVGCRSFELIWASYVAYSVRNESFCCLDKAEAWTGRLLCKYSKSHFLNYVKQATIARDDYPGPVHHWGVNCLNHIVDVASIVEPTVRLIG
ncbi:MAG TPA: hypothetical protein VGG64_22380 [Pirellulales bacterium]|jgi:hypothetical protein